tara:strand:+ start:138315 stop:138911 length:597 start_codon:yes stop_codon:yes gene_type:complete
MNILILVVAILTWSSTWNKNIYDLRLLNIMEKEIINRVAQSKLITFNLEDYYPKGERKVLDIKDWLYEGFILREKEFRAHVEEHDWSNYQDAYVALQCSSDAIVPGWAFMLIASKLQPYAKKVIQGSLENLETALYQTVLDQLDVAEFTDKPVIIKGCSNKPVPENAYLMAVTKIQEVAKSVMYGEACSSVPLFKRKK